MTFLVLRNEEYSILKWFAGIEEVTGAPGLDLPALEVAKVAEAYGVSSRAVSGRDELHAALEGAIGSSATRAGRGSGSPRHGSVLIFGPRSGLLSSEAGGLPAGTLPDELVGQEGEAVTDGLGIDEAHGLLVAGLAEEALAGAEHDWEDDQPQLVDQVMLD